MTRREAVDAILARLEAQATPLVENDTTGSEVLRMIRAARAEAAEAMRRAPRLLAMNAGEEVQP